MNFVPWKEYQKTIPKKRMGAGVLFFDNEGRILVLKPSYKDTWTVPGGACDKNESPRQTGEREVKEEIGLEVKLKQRLAVSYNFPLGEKDENLQWLFYGGVLKPSQIAKIKVDGEEIVEFKFVSLKEAEKLGNRKYLRLRPLFEKAVMAGGAVYLENWEEV
jgi:8-oxo-dGTP pyrophosphatase MutT (NUDIX family)